MSAYLKYGALAIGGAAVAAWLIIIQRGDSGDPLGDSRIFWLGLAGAGWVAAWVAAIFRESRKRRHLGRQTKPLHDELIEQGAQTAPEAESADELFNRLVRPSRAIEIAGGVAVAISVVLKALGVLAFAEGGLLGAIGLAALICGGMWDLLFRRKKHPPRDEEEVRLRDLFRRMRPERGRALK